MTELKILLYRNHDIMTSLNKYKVSDDYIGAILCLTAFEILATFKDGHCFKEGQLGDWRFKTRFITALLDYTCKTFWQVIWEEVVGKNNHLAILWLNNSSQNPERFRIYMIILQLPNSVRFLEIETRYLAAWIGA